MKHLKTFENYNKPLNNEPLNEGFDFSTIKTLVKKHLANFTGDLEELKSELEPYRGKSYAEIKGIIEGQVSESVTIKEYYDPARGATTGYGMPSPEAHRKKAEEQRYLTAAAKFDKTLKGKIIRTCEKIFGIGALSTIITTIAGAYMSFHWDIDPKYFGYGVIAGLISLVLYGITRIVYNLSVPEERPLSKGTNADYSARGLPMP